MSQLFASGGQNIGASESASVLPMNIQDWFPVGLTGLISLQSKGCYLWANLSSAPHFTFLADVFILHLHMFPLSGPIYSHYKDDILISCQSRKERLQQSNTNLGLNLFDPGWIMCLTLNQSQGPWGRDTDISNKVQSRLKIAYFQSLAKNRER